MVIGRVISRISIVITYIRGLITPLITTHEPPPHPRRTRKPPLVAPNLSSPKAR